MNPVQELFTANVSKLIEPNLFFMLMISSTRLLYLIYKLYFTIMLPEQNEDKRILLLEFENLKKAEKRQII